MKPVSLFNRTTWHKRWTAIGGTLGGLIFPSWDAFMTRWFMSHRTRHCYIIANRRHPRPGRH